MRTLVSSLQKHQSLVMMIIITAVMLFSIIAVPSLTHAAAGGQQDCGGNNLFGCNELNGIGLSGEKTPTEIAVSIIKIAMSFLGLIAVGIMLYGGFTWMTAGGNEEKVGEAKKLIAAGIIGLIIILASFSIVTFVLSRLATNVGLVNGA